MKTRCTRKLTLLLSIIVVLTAMTPPAIRHAHAKRDCSERSIGLLAPIGAFGVQNKQPLVAHDDCDESGHRQHSGREFGHGSSAINQNPQTHNCSGQHSHREVADCDCSKCVMTAGPNAHLHILVFGFNLTVPVHEPRDSSGQPTGGERPGLPDVRVVTSAEYVQRPNMTVENARTIFTTFLTAERNESADAPNVARAKSFESRAIPTPPLCDAARNARSGVLLT